MKRILIAVSNVAVVVMTVLVVVVFARAYFVEPARPAALIRPGDGIPDLPSLALSTAHERHLLLVLKDGCPYCQDSMPFYRELVGLQRSGHSATGLVAVLEDPPDAAKQALQAVHLDVPVAAGVPLARWKLAVVPTLLLIDKRGRVLKIWEGRLSRGSEEEVKAIFSS